MKRNCAILLSLALMLAASFSSKAQNIVPIDTFRNDIQTIINNATSSYGMEGIEFSIMLDDNLATETFYSGLRAPGIPVDTSKPWHYAQAVAGYTNYVALKLIEDTLMSMDDSIGMHMNANAMGLDGSITVRQLIKHTSVLNEIWVPSQPSACYSNIWGSAVMGCPIDLLSCFPPDKSSPGTYDNNNANLLVLQFLIDSVTGNSYEIEIQNRIFTPMGMIRSYLSSCDTVTIDSINGIWTTASGYANNQSYLRYFSTNGGNRSLIAKSYEVAKFYRELFQGNLLPPAVMDSVKEVIPGSSINQGSYSCANSIIGFRGYNTDILQIIDNLGDTAILYGKGGFGMNGHLTMHWPDKDWTLSYVHNDRSRQLQHRNLAIDFYCYLRSVDSVSTTIVGLETLSEGRFNLFPNPSNELLNLEFQRPVGEYDYQIMDLSGKILQGEDRFTGNLIEIGDLSPGIYILQVSSEYGLHNERFVKQ